MGHRFALLGSAFEGSLTLKIDEIRGTETVVRRLISGGVLITWLITTLATRWFMDFSWQLAFLFGAIMVVTGPTVVVPMLRTVRPNANIANILRWEGIIIDPVGALLAVLVFEFILSSQGDFALGHTVLTFIKVILAGSLLGVAGGYGLGVILRRHLLPEYLHNTATLTLVFALFALSNIIATESGLLTVTIMGLWLANMKNVDVDHILDFSVARALGSALQSHGFHALLSDTSWDNVRTARMAGLKAFYGNPVSEYADRLLDLVGIGHLLALSPRDDVNKLANLRYQPEFGSNAIYSLAPSVAKGTSVMRLHTVKKFGQVLFSQDTTYAKLASLISQGAEINSTPLSEKFGYQELLAAYGADSLPLFALTPNERLRVFKIDAAIKPAAGWTIISLIRKQAETKENEQTSAQVSVSGRNSGKKT